VAIVGLSSARPTAPLLATGRLGVAQCEALEARLHALREEGRVRVVLVHHTPTPGESPRRRLVDAPALRRVLARAGAELVLHGHAHRAVFASLPGPEGPIPVVGAPSASAPSPKDPSRRAGYHLFAIEPGEGVGAPARIEATTWSLDPASGTFRAAHRSLAPARCPATPRRRAG
jgi:3',5'-cyclic AMP phosphodiesterase CpdA